MPAGNNVSGQCFFTRGDEHAHMRAITLAILSTAERICHGAHWGHLDNDNNVAREHCAGVGDYCTVHNIDITRDFDIRTNINVAPCSHARINLASYVIMALCVKISLLTYFWCALFMKHISCAHYV